MGAIDLDRDELLTRLKTNPSLVGEDLSGADLSGADLSGVDLSRANLNGACLKAMSTVNPR